MAKTSGGSHSEPEMTAPEKRRRTVYLDWVFRVLLGLCALPSLVAAVITIGYFAHTDRPARLLGPLAVPFACAVLMLPWRILLKDRAMQTVTVVAACVAAHQLYASFGTFKALVRSQTLLVLCGVILATGIASLVLHMRRTRRRLWPAALGSVLAVVCFTFGAGDPQWSKYIFIWQVHYSPWRRDAANLPTNRHDIRLTMPKYTEWDARGHKTAEWTHPDGKLLRTAYYPNGQKRMERLYAEDQFVTSWYPDGQMEYHYDRKTRRRRAWDPNGAPREGDVRTSFSDSNQVESLRRYSDGYFEGVHQFWHDQGGKLMREEHYRDGRQDGISRRWNAQGVLVEEEHYVEGYRHGPRKRFRSDGSLDWEETHDRGVLQGSRKSYPAPR